MYGGNIEAEHLSVAVIHLATRSVCSSTNLGKLLPLVRRECVCLCVREGKFAHPHDQIHGDVMEKGRNVTDRVSGEEEESSVSSFLCFITLFAQ